MLIMGLFIVVMIFVIVCFIITFCGAKSTKDDLISMNNSMKKYYKDKFNLDYLKSTHNIRYLGGFKDLGIKNNKISIDFFKDRVRFEFDGDNYKDIMQKDILDCKIQSETQIRQQISMGKIVLLGVFALAGNNTKEINKEFALLDCYYEGDRISIVLDIDFQPSLEQFVRDINRLKNINENTILSDFKPYCE